MAPPRQHPISRNPILKSGHSLIPLLLLFPLWIMLSGRSAGSTLSDPLRAPAPAPAFQTQDCPYDPFEPNDTFSTAYSISPGLWEAVICPQGDEDYFQFSVTAGDTIRLDLTNLPDDFDLFLWDPSGYLTARSQNTGTTSEHIEHVASQTGGYRANVFGYGGVWSVNPYTLQVAVLTPTPTPTPTATNTPTSTPTPTPTSTPTPTPTPTLTPTSICPPDAYEPNDDGFNAAPISPGQIQAYICPQGDEDYYSFYVTGGNVVILDLTNLPENYDLLLWEPGKATPVAASRQPATTPEHVEHYVPSWNNYIAGVFAPQNAWSATPYALRLAIVTPTPTPTGMPGHIKIYLPVLLHM
ncbi:MAG: hypothetical protein GXP39_00955 [Chloroflexi bacterium]|nr:hypothetical protein [Chloroflexota bacterium]